MSPDLLDAGHLQLGQCDACDKFPAVGVCNCIMAQPISVAYCSRCLHEGIECYWIMTSTAAVCGGWDHLAPWAKDVVIRSLPVHDKTMTEFLTDVEQDIRDIAMPNA